MKTHRYLILFFLGIVVIASLSCYLGSCWIHSHCSHQSCDLHLWIHQQLDISPEQEKKLQATENRYIEKKKYNEEIIRLANMELSQEILKSKSHTPEIEQILQKIQQAQGELQKATLEHVFEMKVGLTSEQYDKLLNLTANALYQSDSKK